MFTRGTILLYAIRNNLLGREELEYLHLEGVVFEKQAESWVSFPPIGSWNWIIVWGNYSALVPGPILPKYISTDTLVRLLTAQSIGIRSNNISVLKISHSIEVLTSIHWFESEDVFFACQHVFKHGRLIASNVQTAECVWQILCRGFWAWDIQRLRAYWQ